MEQLHIRHKVLHNDLKNDNVVLNQTVTGACAVIIDFGKACEINEGKRYSLSVKEKDRYKSHHPQVAPDLCDGLCKQNVATDIYSVGRIMNIINVNTSLKCAKVKKVSQECMQYSGILRPDMASIKQSLKLI